MSYFDVYTKRINRYGTNLQERVQGKREHDFKVFMKRSPNLVRARNGEDEKVYKAVLQTKEYDQDEVTDYLLVPLDNKIEMGTIIYTADSRHDDVDYEGTRHYIMDDDTVYSARRWINYAVDPYTSAGYNRYTVVELESELLWVDEGIKYSSFAHAVGGGSGARDKNINLKFNTQFSEAGVYLPNKRYSIIMPTHPHLRKNMKITLGGETWRVTGFDSISVKGVSYVTLEETLTDKREDIPIANASQLKDWTVITDRGADFAVSSGSFTQIELTFFYKGERKEVDYELLEDDKGLYTVAKGKDGKVTIYTKSVPTTKQTSLKIIIEGVNDKDSYFEVPFFIGYADIPLHATGPSEITVGEIETYTVFCYSKISLSNNTAEILSEKNLGNGYKTIQIKGLSIGKNQILIGKEDPVFDFEVKSMWLGGNE